MQKVVGSNPISRFYLQSSAFHHDCEFRIGRFSIAFLGTRRSNQGRILRRFWALVPENGLLRGSALIGEERLRPTQ